MRIRSSSRRAVAGHTLIEIVVGTALFMVLMGSIALISSTGTRLFKTSITQQDVESQARRALNRVQRALLSSDQGALAALPASPLWDERIIFDQPEEISTRTGVIDWTSTLIEFRYDNGEVDDGVDNDGDGLIDEGVVVLVKDWNGPDEKTVTLCHGVSEYLENEILDGDDDNGNQLIDERGLSFARVDQNLVIRLSLERVDDEGRLFVRTFETSVWLRN
jgi:hypothetical protein